MINKIVILSKHCRLESSTVIESELFTGIIIHDPRHHPVMLPRFIKPILRLEYYGDQFSRRWNFNTIMAERVISFLDSLESSDSNFTLLVQSDRGLHRSAAIARIIKAVKTNKVEVIGLVKPLEECNPDQTTMKYLTAEWSRKMAIDAEKHR